MAAVSVGLSLLFGLFAGYAFAVYTFPLRTQLFLLILGTLMVPVQVTSVGLYIFVVRTGWVVRGLSQEGLPGLPQKASPAAPHARTRR